MQKLKTFIANENTLVFFFCMAVMAGPALSTIFSYDISQFPDCRSYLGLAEWNFDQSPIRRYRVIIPFAARILNTVFGGAFTHLTPSYFTGNFSLPFSFFLINIVLTSLYGLLIYKYCKSYGTGAIAALMGLLVMLTSRYTIYIAALPLADSLYCVTVMLALLGVKEKNTGMQLLAIFLGPFAKEAFIFMVPVIFFFSHISKGRLLVYFILSGIIVFGYRYLYDYLAGPGEIDGLRADLMHLGNLGKVFRLFGFYNIYKVLSVIGLWILLPVAAAAIVPGYKTVLKATLDKVIAVFLATVLVQMLLSESVERMFYQAMPVLVLIASVSFAALRKHYDLRKNKFI